MRFAVCIVLLFASEVFAQGVVVPTLQDLEAAKYDDAELRERIASIENAIAELGNAVDPPPKDELDPPVVPDPPVLPPVGPEPFDVLSLLSE